MKGIEVINIEEHEDGSGTLHLELNDEFIKIFNKICGTDKFDEDKFRELVMDALSSERLESYMLDLEEVEK